MKTKYIIAIAAAAGVAYFFKSKSGKAMFEKMSCHCSDMISKAKTDLFKEIKDMASDANSKIHKSL